MTTRLFGAAGRFGGLLTRGQAEPAVTDPPKAAIGEEPRPDGCLLWVLSDSAASAGPAPVVAEELSQLIEEPVHLVLTTNSLDGMPLADSALFAPAPRDTPEDAAAFLEHWSPDFGLVIGTPNTPKLLQEAARRAVPLFHASADRNGGIRYPNYLHQFNTCLAASAAEAQTMQQQFRGKGVKVETTGPLSDTVLAPPCNQAECDELAKLLGGRPVWLASLVDLEEVDMVEKAQRKAFRSAHRLLLIIVPRHPSEGEGIASALETDGWRTGLRSKGDEPDPEIQIYVADTTDEMGLWYRLAPSTFVGGTFLPDRVPGDPYHAATLGSAVLHGPHTGKSPARFDKLGKQGASLKVLNADQLGEAVISLLSPDKAASLAQAGWATTTESAPVVERLAELMHAEFEEREGRA